MIPASVGPLIYKSVCHAVLLCAERIEVLLAVETLGGPRNIVLETEVPISHRIRCGRRQITLATA